MEEGVIHVTICSQVAAFSFRPVLGIIEAVLEVSGMSFSMTTIIVLTVFILFLTAILTSSYNDDKTKGL